jgi:hypothetical protein
MPDLNKWFWEAPTAAVWALPLIPVALFATGVGFLVMIARNPVLILHLFWLLIYGAIFGILAGIIWIVRKGIQEQKVKEKEK